MSNPYLTAGKAAAASSGNPYLNAGKAVPSAAPPAHHGFLGSIVHNPVTALTSHLGSDIGNTLIGVGPGVYGLGKAVVLDEKDMLQGKNAHRTLDILKGVGKGYEDYYGHNLFSHLYQHPLQPILDAATLASGGVAVGSKIAKVVAPESTVAKLGERGTLVTRSPRNIATGKGPVHTDLTSVVPQVHARQLIAHKVRQALPEGKVKRVKVPLGGETKLYGKQIYSQASHNALGELTHLEPYTKATKHLTANEWTALHLRAMDIHPDDLLAFWKGTPKEAVAKDPKIRQLVLNPSKRMVKAEPELRVFSQRGADLLQKNGELNAETAAARPGKTRLQAAEALGRPVKEITGDPYYFPHTAEPVRVQSPLEARGGGKAPPRRLGTTKENKGILALSGHLHLRSDVLGPEFLRRVTHVKYDEIHNALRRGAVRVTGAELDSHYGGKPPKGWEFLRPNASTRIPFTRRGESDVAQPIEHLIPKPDDLRDSPLGKGFSTSDREEAFKANDTYYILPKTTVKAATGEFTRSGNFTYNFVHRPLKVWRAIVLGLRVGFLTNNLVGNSVMYAVRTGGKGALRDLFGAILEAHGRDTGLRILRNPATPPGVRADLMKEFFPEQIQGVFGRTQTPATNPAHIAGRKVSEAARTATGAIPRLTAKVAEEYPRRALIRNAIRNSPEFRKVYRALPKQTRTFETAARQLLEGKGGKPYQRMISKQVNQALGDYLNMSPFERNVMRNALPFYSWYRAITVTTAHLAADTPLRANILGQIGQLGKQQSDAQLGDVPSFLEGAIGLGAGANGTKKVLSTQGFNPYATIPQLLRGGSTDLGSLGLNPFLQAPLDVYAQAKQRHQSVSPSALIAKTLEDVVKSLPPSLLAMPPGPSKLYPNRKGRKTQVESFLGVPIKEYDPAVAAQQKAQGR